MQTIRVQIYEMIPGGMSPGGSGGRRDLGEVKLSVPEIDVQHRARWAALLRKEVAAMGYEVLSCSQIHQPGDGAKYAAIVKIVAPTLRKRPVTRGGKPVEAAVKKPTMAGRRRRGH